MLTATVTLELNWILNVSEAMRGAERQSSRGVEAKSRDNIRRFLACRKRRGPGVDHYSQCTRVEDRREGTI